MGIVGLLAACSPTGDAVPDAVARLDPDELLRRVRAMYRDLTSYGDEGSVTSTFWEGGRVVLTERARFASHYSATARALALDFETIAIGAERRDCRVRVCSAGSYLGLGSRGGLEVVWTEVAAPHQALSYQAGLSRGVTNAIPLLLMPGVSNARGLLDIEPRPTIDVRDAHYTVDGDLEDGVVTVVVDADSYLVHEIVHCFDVDGIRVEHKIQYEPRVAGPEHSPCDRDPLTRSRG